MSIKSAVRHLHTPFPCPGTNHSDTGANTPPEGVHPPLLLPPPPAHVSVRRDNS